MTVNSRVKGKNSERQFAAHLLSLGILARRGQQYNGSDGSADVVSEDLPHVHFEVKVRKRFDIGTEEMRAARNQARDECKGKMPVVVWRRHGCRTWLLTFTAISPAVEVTTEATAEVLRWLNSVGEPKP